LETVEMETGNGKWNENGQNLMQMNVRLKLLINDTGDLM